MTTLNKPVFRKTRFNFASYGVDKRPIVVGIEPVGNEGDFIKLRLLKRQEELRIDVRDLYTLLLKNKVMHKRMEKIRKKRKNVKRFIRLTA